MTTRIAMWRQELGIHWRWWVGLALALPGGILGVQFGFAGNYIATAVFACMFVVGMWLRP